MIRPKNFNKFGKKVKSSRLMPFFVKYARLVTCKNRVKKSFFKPGTKRVLANSSIVNNFGVEKLSLINKLKGCYSKLLPAGNSINNAVSNSKCNSLLQNEFLYRTPLYRKIVLKHNQFSRGALFLNYNVNCLQYRSVKKIKSVRKLKLTAGSIRGRKKVKKIVIKRISAHLAMMRFCPMSFRKRQLSVVKVKKHLLKYKTSHLINLNNKSLYTAKIKKTSIQNYLLMRLWDALSHTILTSNNNLKGRLSAVFSLITIWLNHQQKLLNSVRHNINLSAFRYVKLSFRAPKKLTFLTYCKINIIFDRSNVSSMWFKKISPKQLLIVNIYTNELYYISLNAINFIIFNIKILKDYKLINILVYKISKKTNLSRTNYIVPFKKGMKAKTLNTPTHTPQLKQHFVKKLKPDEWFSLINVNQTKNFENAWFNSDRCLPFTANITKMIWQNQSSSVLLGNQVKNFKLATLRLNIISAKRLNRQLLNYELKSFRWKFFRKRWYFVQSRWKQALVFRGIIKKAWNNYRKISKNFIFIKLFHMHLFHSFGISIADIKLFWYSLRRGFAYSSNTNTVQRAHSILQLKLDSLALIFGLAVNRPLAQEFVKCGGFKINGSTLTNYNFTMLVSDVLQFNNYTNLNLKYLKDNSYPASLKININCLKFFQPLFSTISFILIRWPWSYELIEESIITERWLRYYIRYYPSRKSKFKDPKVKWLKY